MTQAGSKVGRKQMNKQTVPWGTEQNRHHGPCSIPDGMQIALNWKFYRPFAPTVHLVVLNLLTLPTGRKFRSSSR